MRKLWKCRKALSPVVAAIILIAVTVAVSIAVAAWMGSLTMTFMGTEQVTFTNWQWDTTGDVNWFIFTIKNTGSADLSVQEVRIDSVAPSWTGYSATGAAPWTTLSTTAYLLTKNSQVSFNVTRTGNYVHGGVYEFTVISKGNTFGPYTKTAP